MRIHLLTAALSATSLLACATQTTTTGGGGTGGTGGTGGATTTTTDTGGGGAGGDGGGGGSGATGGGGTGGGTTTTTSSTTTTTTTEDLCGNGVKDPGEQCDGADYGGKTCASIGFSGGTLQCNNFCAIVASGCTPPESCSNSQDDDQDGQIDCLDPDCAAQPVCLDSCASPTVVASLPSFPFADTTGRPAVQTSSCSAAAGSEYVFQLTAPETVDMTVTLYSFGIADLTVSVRTTCADVATELHCENALGANQFPSEQFLFPIVKDQTYFIIVDGVTANDYGQFELDLQIPQPEFDFQCEDQFDNDFDGYLDCDDPSDCQSSFYCMPGADLPGAQCFGNNECAATGNDPICLTEQQGFLDGYCSEFCDLANPVCAGDGICADPASVTGKAISKNGICFDACVSNGDCRPGYECVDRGLSSTVCIVAPEKQCGNFMDDDADGLPDCADPDCQAAPECVPGAKAAGQPCAQSNECFANLNDPLCLSEQFFGYPGGYCTQYCDAAAMDCGSGALCVAGWVPIDTPVCLDKCAAQGDCRAGYSCLDIGFPSKVCVF